MANFSSGSGYLMVSWYMNLAASLPAYAAMLTASVLASKQKGAGIVSRSKITKILKRIYIPIAAVLSIAGIIWCYEGPSPSHIFSSYLPGIILGGVTPFAAALLAIYIPLRKTKDEKEKQKDGIPVVTDKASDPAYMPAKKYVIKSIIWFLCLETAFGALTLLAIYLSDL